MSREFRLNCVISFIFYLYLMLHTCVQRFDVMGNLKKICKILELNSTLQRRRRAVSAENRSWMEFHRFPCSSWLLCSPGARKANGIRVTETKTAKWRPEARGSPDRLRRNVAAVGWCWCECAHHPAGSGIASAETSAAALGRMN